MGRFRTTVTVADINLDSAQRFAQALGDSRVDALRVDASKRSQLVNVFKGYDLVMNTVEPYYRFAVPVVKVAIETGVNYIDICDDVEPTMELLKLDKEARDSGVFVVVGLGASPGLTNLIVKDLVQPFEQVDEIIIAWVVGEETGEEEVGGLSEGQAVIEHMLHISSGEVITFKGGRHIKIPAFRKGVKLPFPKPLGKYTCYHVAHPEVVTLPNYITGVRTVSNLGSLYPEINNFIFQQLGKAVENGKHTIETAALEIVKLQKEQAVEEGKKGEKREPSPSGLYLAVIGTRSGDRGMNYYTTCSYEPMSASTGQPLACGVIYFARGSIIKPGVHAPESVFSIGNILEIASQYNLSFARGGESVTDMGWSKKLISAVKS
ncbi:MAG: saccharopine dehydrogenase family protein [Candidatus Jordarchaeum sp.]|uniref:saccharopine dehydrogenase family protein n=1 Tax=Candidatus Jordarchaeum sp. TaxID=2823881 RepID=UPI004049BE49